MKSLFDEVVAGVREMPRDEQERIAIVVLEFMRLRDDAFARA